jgi:acetoin utilization protein AcuB
MPTLTSVGEIMTKSVYTVTLEDTVRKADEIMKSEGFSQVPVLEDGKFIGLITERSLMEYSLRQLYEFDDAYGEAGYNKILDFEEIMTKNVRIIYPEDSIKKAIELMTKHKTYCLPVVDWKNYLVGLVTANDILLFFHKKLSEM